MRVKKISKAITALIFNVGNRKFMLDFNSKSMSIELFTARIGEVHKSVFKI